MAMRLGDLVRVPMLRWTAVGFWAVFAGLGSAQAQDFGMYPMLVVPPGEIRASEYFLDHAPPKATLVLAASNFPSHLNARYVLHNATQSQNDPALDESPQFPGNGLKHTKPRALARAVTEIAMGKGYLVIAPSMYPYNEYYGVYTPGTLSGLAPRLKKSRYWHLWYERDGVVIFQAVPHGRTR
jgi:hypothetical protein